MFLPFHAHEVLASNTEGEHKDVMIHSMVTAMGVSGMVVQRNFSGNELITDGYRKALCHG